MFLGKPAGDLELCSHAPDRMMSFRVSRVLETRRAIAIQAVSSQELALEAVRVHFRETRPRGVVAPS